MDQDQELLQKLNKGAKNLDQIEVATPEFAHFKALVDRQQALIRRTQRIQLILFIVVALALVSGLVLLSGRFEAFFVLIQAAAFGGAIVGLSFAYVRARRQAQGAH